MKEGKTLIVIVILVILVIGVMMSRIKIEVKRFNFKSNNKIHINKDYLIKIKIYIFCKIPILSFNVTNNIIQKILINKKLREKVNVEKNKILKDKNNIDLKRFIDLKYFKINIEKMDLNILIGSENAALTAIIVPIITTVIAIVFKNKVKEINKNQRLQIKPIFENQNLLNIYFSGIFEIKMIHIIKTICIMNKKRKGDKNERASYRRTYDYGYEEY